jgi:hypothetical protein
MTAARAEESFHAFVEFFTELIANARASQEGRRLPGSAVAAAQAHCSWGRPGSYDRCFAACPGLALAGPFEPEPYCVHGCGHDAVPGHKGVLVPPEGQCLYRSAYRLPRHLDLGRRPRRKLGSHQGQQRCPARCRHFGMHGCYCRVAGRVPKQHSPGKRVRLDVGEPCLERAPGLLGPGACPGCQMMHPDVTELREMLLEQPTMQVLLGAEVVVDDRNRNAGAAGDLADRSSVVALFGEQLGCRLLDELSSRLGSQSTAGR